MPNDVAPTPQPHKGFSWSKFLRNTSYAVGIIVTLGGAGFGTYSWIDSYYIDKHELKEEKNALVEEIAKLDRSFRAVGTSYIKNQIIEVESDLERLEALSQSEGLTPAQRQLRSQARLRLEDLKRTLDQLRR